MLGSPNKALVWGKIEKYLSEDVETLCEKSKYVRI